MKIEWLREFLALAQTLNYRIASETVFISQSTLSKHIKCLESEIGVDLFKRDTKRVILTENGKAFYDHAEKIVREYDDVLDEFSGKHPVKGTLRIAGGIRMPLINEFLCPAIASFEAKYPDVDIYTEDTQWEDYRSSLLSGAYDVVFSVRLPMTNEEGLCFSDIWSLPLCAWMPKDGPFEDREVVTFEELSHLYLRILNPHKCPQYTSYVRDLFDKRGYSVKLGKPLNWVFSMDGTGFGVTPKFSPTEGFGAGIRLYDIEGAEEMTLSLVRRKREFNPIVELFLTELALFAPSVFEPC